jgi:uncharacterized protein (DUF362 family)
MTHLTPFGSDRRWRSRLGKLLPGRVAKLLRPKPYDPAVFTLPAQSDVCLFPASTYHADFAGLIRNGLADLDIDVRGRTVLLKPNLVEYESGSVINTNPLVVAGAADACLRNGAAEVIVAEGPGHRRDIEYLLTAAGLDGHLADLRLEFVDLNHDDVVMVPLRSHFSTWRQIVLPKTLLRADIVVSMPKLKTHHWAGMTASMKNLFGVVPGAVYGWPKNPLHIHGIPNWVVDLTATVRPHLAIVDAVVGMEGDGPIMGSARPLGFIAMGTDLVAVDATCARIIGLDPAKIPYLAMAGRFLGNADERRIVQRAELPARYATRVELLDQFRHMRLVA